MPPPRIGDTWVTKKGTFTHRVPTVIPAVTASSRRPASRPERDEAVAWLEGNVGGKPSTWNMMAYRDGGSEFVVFYFREGRHAEAFRSQFPEFLAGPREPDASPRI